MYIPVCDYEQAPSLRGMQEHLSSRCLPKYETCVVLARLVAQAVKPETGREDVAIMTFYTLTQEFLVNPWSG